MSDPIDPYQVRRRLRESATRILAAREHSAVELKAKLARKFAGAPREMLDAVIDELMAQGLQSDTRFAEALVRSRMSRGYGPAYIEQELRAKGIADRAWRELEIWSEADWPAHARRWLDRHGDHDPRDRDEWAKLMRRLSQRGYPSEVLREVLGDVPYS